MNVHMFKTQKVMFRPKNKNEYEKFSLLEQTDAEFIKIKGAFMEKSIHNHTEILHKVINDMPNDEKLLDLANLFKLFADETRVKILYSLFESELCVCAISELLGKSQSVISHSLKVLKNGKLVDCRREGKTVYYFLTDNHVRTIIAQGFDHITEED